MAFGLTASGFSKKRLEDIQAEIEADLRLTFGDFINLRAGSVFNLLVGIMAERISQVWELSEAVYASQYPDTAEGVNLDNVAAITGITRQAATQSLQENLYLFGTAGTLVPAGTQVSVDGAPASQFLTLLPITLIVGTDEVQDIDFSAVPASGTWRLKYFDQETTSLAFNANAAAVQAALNALSRLSGVTVTGNYTSGFTVTFSGNDGQVPQPLLVVSQNSLLDGGAFAVITTVVETTPGVEQGRVNAEATVTGPVNAPAFSLTVIDTPVLGLDRVINFEDAMLGRNRETDAEFRLRRNLTLQRAGAGTVEAIRSRLLDLEDVTAAIVFENSSQVTDLNGRPAKSFEAIVQGGDNQAIADLLWLVKPAGIATFGSITETITDSMNFTHPIKFSRPTNIQIYCDLIITEDIEGFPANGAQLVEDAVIAYVNGLGIGKDVIVYPGLIAAINPIPGIVDIEVAIGIAPAPTLDDNIVIAANEVAQLDSSNISVTVI